MDSEMIGILLSDSMHYTIVVSLEMSDEPYIFLANIHQDLDNTKFSKVFLLYVSQIKGNDVMVIQCFISEDNHQIKPFYELKEPNNQGGREKREECKSSA